MLASSSAVKCRTRHCAPNKSGHSLSAEDELFSLQILMYRWQQGEQAARRHRMSFSILWALRRHLTSLILQMLTKWVQMSALITCCRALVVFPVKMFSIAPL